MLRGFDASSVQGSLPFGKLDPSFRFVILKAQQGNDGFDPDFAANTRAALAAGLHVIPYCFAYPLESDGSGAHPGRTPAEQAKLFVDRIRAAWPGWHGVLCLDCEWPEPSDWATWKVTAASISTWLRGCCDELVKLGVRVVLYTYPDWWHHVAPGDVSWAGVYPLWLARYVAAWPKDGDSPQLLAPWTSWLFWQWDGNGGQRLPNGVDADFCVFNGAEEELAAFLAPAPSLQDADDSPTVHAAVDFDPPAPPSTG